VPPGVQLSTQAGCCGLSRLDEVMDRVDAGGLTLTGEGGSCPR
jgi:hypothetical protein